MMELTDALELENSHPRFGPVKKVLVFLPPLGTKRCDMTAKLCEG